MVTKLKEIIETVAIGTSAVAANLVDSSMVLVAEEGVATVVTGLTRMIGPSTVTTTVKATTSTRMVTIRTAKAVVAVTEAGEVLTVQGPTAAEWIEEVGHTLIVL